MQYSCRADDKFDVEKVPSVNMYNTYTSGGMNAIVFQEMREARGLAYSAYSYLGEGARVEFPHYFYAFIATQNDKMRQAIEAFDEIIENMPESESAFELAKQGVLANLESTRTTKANVLWKYVDNLRKGLPADYDEDKIIYENTKDMTLADVVKLQQENIKGRKYNNYIISDKKE